MDASAATMGAAMTLEAIFFPLSLLLLLFLYYPFARRPTTLFWLSGFVRVPGRGVYVGRGRRGTRGSMCTRAHTTLVALSMWVVGETMFCVSTSA